MAAPDLPAPPASDLPLAVHTHIVPALVEPSAFAGCTAVIIDVLRATTTIAELLRAGATSVHPFLTVDEVRACHAEMEASHFCRGGERGGQCIEGFELDNSPRGLTRERVGGKQVLFTTTNGTAALLHARAAERIVLAAFTNLTAVCKAIVNDPRPIRILCAGTRGQTSLEDCLVAGAIVDRLSAARPLSEEDGGRLCVEAWRNTLVQPGGILRAFRASRGGRNLERLGFDADVEYCANVDVHAVVPEYDAKAGVIVATLRA